MKDIAKMRKEAGFSTQEHFAEALGLPRSTIGKWEAGLCVPGIKNLQRLAKMLNCTVDELLAESPPEEQEKAAPA